MTIETNAWINPRNGETRHYTQATLAQLTGQEASGKLWIDSAGALHLDKFSSNEITQEEALELSKQAIEEAGGIDNFARYPFSIEEVLAAIFTHQEKEADGIEISGLRGITSLTLWQYPEDFEENEDPTMDIEMKIEGCKPKESFTVRLTNGRAAVGSRIQAAADSALQRQKLIEAVNR